MKNQLNEYKKSLPNLHSFRVSVGMAYNAGIDVLSHKSPADTLPQLSYDFLYFIKY